tara:strand:- start:1131 stop:2240 length:1110 start_codon:yes stop_codon:yes gene_type:complete
MKKIVFFTSIITALIFTSCETDIKTKAEYKDMTIVYGLLDPSETDHYIKINKGFIGEGSANDLAANADNYNYANGEISVKIDEFTPSGVYVDEYKLDRVVNDIPKDDGVFDNTTNVLYKFTKANLNTDNIYKLSIYNIAIEKTVSAETGIVKNPTASVFNIIDLMNSSYTAKTQIFDLTPSSNLGRVKAEFVFNYIEFTLEDTDDNSSTPKDTVLRDKSIRISMGEELATNLQGNNLSFSISGNDLFSAIESKIPTTTANLIQRRIKNATIEYTLAGIDLSTYMSINDPSVGISQNKPDFTNITNGLGLFSSRTIYVKKSAGVPDIGEVGYDGRINLSEYTIKKIITMGREFCTEVKTGTGSTPQNICQ